MDTYSDLMEQLDAFDPRARRAALRELKAAHAGGHGPVGSNVNMHFHSFFSYNAADWSPSHIAWEARRAGLYAAGLCDFDVLDGLEEFLEAGRILGLRSTVNVETRAYLDVFKDVDISSPGEPGVTYIMGGGFFRPPPDGSPQAAGLAGYRDRARARNIALLGRINPHLTDIAIDYETDVLPLTPMGGATERHIVTAYVNKARDVFEHPQRTAEYWAGVLEMDDEAALDLLADRPALEETVRSRLVKRGGIGYEPPSPDTFPTVADFAQWVRSCGAIPMVTWLDGTSGGESDPDALLTCMRDLGCAALNIIPDRNWNVKDPARQAVKTANLKAIVEAADALNLPINIGTEMNKLGLPFADELDGEYLRPFKETFLRGACVMVGHTRLARYAGMPYLGDRAEQRLPDLKQRNDFFARVGALEPVSETLAAEYDAAGPDAALDRMCGSAGGF